METAAGELSYFRLLLVEDSAFEPARANYAIRLAAPTHQVMKRTRWAGTIGVHIANQVPQWSKFQSFDQGAALADGFRKIERTDEWKLGGDFLDDAKGIVFATVEHHDELKFAVIFPLKITAILAQNGFDAALLVVSRDQEQKTGLTHGGVRECS